MKTLSRCVGSFVAGLGMVLALGACETFDASDNDDSSESDRPAGVARGAEVVESGSGDLDYVPPSSGSVYVVDATTGKMLFSRQVEKGQKIAVEPGEDEVRLGGLPVLKRDLKSDHTHAIWFRPSKGSATDGGEGAIAGKELPKEMWGARRIVTGKGDLAITAPSDGKVFLYDQSSKQVMYRADLRKGERLRIDAEENTIELEGQGRSPATAEKNKLYPNHQYAIYFDPK